MGSASGQVPSPRGGPPSGERRRPAGSRGRTGSDHVSRVGGVIPMLVTHFATNGAVDFHQLEREIDFLMGRGQMGALRLWERGPASRDRRARSDNDARCALRARTDWRHRQRGGNECSSWDRSSRTRPEIGCPTSYVAAKGPGRCRETTRSSTRLLRWRRAGRCRRRPGRAADNGCLRCRHPLSLACCLRCHPSLPSGSNLPPLQRRWRTSRDSSAAPRDDDWRLRWH
jgi:hypothetical protein